jgi:hypothetical protein
MQHACMKIKPKYSIAALICLGVLVTASYAIIPTRLDWVHFNNGSSVVISQNNMPTTSPEVSTSSPSKPLTLPDNTEVAVWMWQSPTHYLANNGEIERIFTQLRNSGVNAVYIRIDDYIDIIETRAGTKRDADLSRFEADLQAFTKTASRYGMTVYALAGKDTWEQPELSYIPVQLVEYVIDYNRRAESNERLAGIQYDIESYSSSRFAIPENQLQILNNFVKLVETIVTTVRTEQPDLVVGMALPYWLDNSTRVLPTISFNNKNQAALFHTIDLLNTIENGQVVIMAYRNFAVGTNGALELVAEEIAYANQGSTTVVVALETLDYGEPSNATFFGKTLKTFVFEANKIDSQLDSNRSYGGIAIHHLDSFFLLKR